MNLTIAKEQILNGLQAVQNIVTSRTTLPVLSNVLLRAEGSRLELTATDLDVTISSSVEAGVKKPGTTTIPVKKLFGIIRELGAASWETAVLEVTTHHAGRRPATVSVMLHHPQRLSLAALAQSRARQLARHRRVSQ